MKRSSIERLALFGAICIFITISGSMIVSNQQTIIYNQHELMEVIGKRNYLDSITYDHLKDCSYIDKESVEVGYNGYLKSVYINGYGKAR